MDWFRRRICRWFGHNYWMVFGSKGAFWCQSAGGYDCVCQRCNDKWETTDAGMTKLKEHRKGDPRFQPLCTRCELRKQEEGGTMCGWCGI